MDLTFIVFFGFMALVILVAILVKSDIKAMDREIVSLHSENRDLANRVKMQSMALDRLFKVPNVDVAYDENAFELERAHGAEDLCYDVRISEDYVVKSGRQILPTGIKMRPQKGVHAILCPTSGNTVKGMKCLADGQEVWDDADVRLGIVDQGYRKAVGVMYYSEKEGEGHIIKRGTKVGQMWFVKADEVNLNKVDDIEADSSRGLNGFGSGHKS